MKAFNVSFYDDRRLCFMEGCTPSMLAFKWDHAVCAQPPNRPCKLHALKRIALFNILVYVSVHNKDSS